MPCRHCGASVARKEIEQHVCDPERKLEYELFTLRDEIGEFESQLAHYLDTPRGRFALWIAERDRRQLG